MPYEAVDYRKRHRIIATSKYYIMTHNLDNTDLRYDIISILGDNITHYENAF